LPLQAKPELRIKISVYCGKQELACLDSRRLASKPSSQPVTEEIGHALLFFFTRDNEPQYIDVIGAGVVSMDF
jgi:hypothetical protein